MDEPTEGMGPDAALEVAIGTLYMAIDGKVETHPERMRKAAVALAVLRSQTRRAVLSPTARTALDSLRRDISLAVGISEFLRAEYTRMLDTVLGSASTKEDK